ncbi:thioredoxin-like protein [Microdochium trichocladiopsis]|uniref:thioredoxin-dependent peroxiredoxin n=1 Tax=Microdochium trichocladiopsis TaxID=1682393 RepID=A0A9P8Y2V1_9PEZI|nr:thioredoxin-like protein [Microdochium trichocladiopsis]KAH7026153.1 thioredoxin-like protein [Microdochium trichocladiopsis]
MPVELRKRKAPAAPPPPAPKRQSKASKVATKVKEAVTGKSGATASPAAKPGARPSVGAQIDLEGFGGEIETNDGEKTTLKALVEQSQSGVVLFTYPKASTPGCTTQACLFRDSYEPLTSGGLAIYGLSKDSPKANTTFKEKQKLPYPLLCDPSATLIAAIGLKKQPSGTQRGVFAVDKSGKVLLSEPGGPAATVEAVKKLVASTGASADAADVAEAKEEEEAEEKEKEPAAAAVNGDSTEEAKKDEA